MGESFLQYRMKSFGGLGLKWATDWLEIKQLDSRLFSIKSSQIQEIRCEVSLAKIALISWVTTMYFYER